VIMSKFLTVVLNFYGAAFISVVGFIAAFRALISGKQLEHVGKIILASAIFGALAFWTRRELKKEKDGEV